MTELQRQVYEHFTTSEAASRMLRAADGGKSKQAPRVRVYARFAVSETLHAVLLPPPVRFSVQCMHLPDADAAPQCHFPCIVLKTLTLLLAMRQHGIAHCRCCRPSLP